MRAIIAAALTAAVLGGACRPPPEEVGTAAEPLTANQLVLFWHHKVEFGDQVKHGEGPVIATLADRPLALQQAAATKQVLCGSNATCLREAVTGLRLRLCDPSGSCGMDAIGHAVGWVALAARYGAEHARMMEFLEGQSFQAHGIRLTLEEYAQSQKLIRWFIDEATVGKHASIQIANAARARLAEIGAAATSEEQVRLAETRRTIRELDRITGRYQADLDAVQAAYGNVAARHKAYRLEETPVFTALKEIATQASGTALSGMASLKVALAGHSDHENRTPQTLILDAKRVRADLSEAQARYERALLPHSTYLVQKGIPVLDHTGAPKAGMDSVVAYAEGRMSRVNAAVIAIYDGIRRREAALALSAAEAATRVQIRTADAAHREAAFLNEVTARVAEIWKAPPTSALGLPLQAERLSAMTAFLQFESLCQDLSELAAWRGPGCQEVAAEATKVRTYLAQTLPFTLRFGVNKMRAAGFAESVLSEIETLVTAGNLKLAVHKYDAVLNAAKEG